MFERYLIKCEGHIWDSTNDLNKAIKEARRCLNELRYSEVYISDVEDNFRCIWYNDGTVIY